MEHAYITLPDCNMTVWPEAPYIEWVRHALALAETHSYMVSESLALKQVQVFAPNHRWLLSFTGADDTLLRIEYWSRATRAFIPWKDFNTIPALSSDRTSLYHLRDRFIWRDGETRQAVAQLHIPSGLLELLPGWAKTPDCEQELVVNATSWINTEMPQLFSRGVVLS
jgi:hypothetical protein